MQAERTSYAVDGWGEGELWTTRDHVLAHDFRFGVRQLAAPHEGGGDPPSGTVARESAQVGNGSVADWRRVSGLPLDPEALVQRLRAFLAGEEAGLEDVPLDLASSSPFQQAVASALRAVSRGEVVTYAELAALAGHPGAQRAVGTFCARNRFMFLLPCHRVVGSEGIGGYGSSGVAIKRRLLALEGVVL